ncbi:MAG: hypothetical protein KA028_00715 [Candidatus Pacebacteria bacterium]|nr:hypothetical protein [Candidatus Paceibacterota bacterium]MBP9852019.1 hypothetical protein [Candidatus Paceibacterota bacterium]
MNNQNKKKNIILFAAIALFAIAAVAYLVVPEGQRTAFLPEGQELAIDTPIDYEAGDNSTESDNVIDMAKTAIPAKVVNPAAKNMSAWLWEAPDSFTKAQLDKMFAIAKAEKITMIYVRMDDYIDLYSIKDTKIRTQKVGAFDAAAKQFITTAAAYGIKVQALGGDTGWSELAQREYAYKVFDGVIKYNKANPSAQFVGIQYDVEANNDPAYKIDKTKTLKNYLDFAKIMVDKSKANGNFTIGFAIPFWYDNENNNGVIVDWGGKGSKPVGYHLFDILNGTNGYAVLMDYRNYAAGTDGSILNAKKELDYVVANKLTTKIIIGQETTDVLPRKITFFDKSKAIFKAEAAKIVAAFSSNLNFGGIAVHHLPSYIDL